MPDLRILDGVAEAIPLSDGALDAVVVGQAFHWFDAPAALAEIARVLRPGGRLGLVWNTRDESEPWVARLSALLDRHAGDAPRHQDMAWRPALAASPRFGPLLERGFRYNHAGTVATHRDHVASISFIACLAPPECAAFLGQVSALLTRHADPDGRLVMPYRTRVFWTALRA